MHHQLLTVADLLKDQSFINYCRRQNQQDVQYWEKFIAENPEKKPLIDEAIHEYSILFTALANADLEEQMQKLRLKLEADEVNDGAPVVTLHGSGKNFSRRFRYLIGTAAILLLAAGYFLWKQPETMPQASKETEYASKPGERKSFQLPDGTQVSLNAGSTIVVGDSYGQSSRDVYLKGEAFFEVQHNKLLPFIVHTSDMDVKALGTAFNVRSYNGEKSETALLRGLVEVTLKKDNNRKVLLHPDEKISWSTLVKKNVNTTATPPAKKETDEAPAIKHIKKLEDGSVKEVAWMENKLAFDNDAFEDIVPQLARWYNVEISFDAEEVKHYHFTVTFKKEKLEQVLAILGTIRPFKYRYDGKTIVISK
jgi:transmembrane sensor